jgi:hypothetical protein
VRARVVQFLDYDRRERVVTADDDVAGHGHSRSATSRMSTRFS